MYERPPCPGPSLSTWIFAGLLATLWGVGPAFAGQPSQEEVAAFEKHIASGGALLGEENYAEAVDELEQALQIIDHPRVAVRLAEAYREWGRCSQAEKKFDLIVERQDIDDETLEIAREKMEQLDDCVATATLSIQCTPEDARLFLSGDGQEREMECPLEDDLVAQAWKVRAVAEDYEEMTRDVVLEEGKTKELTLALEREMQKIEVSEEEGPDWMSIASYGAMGTGAALLVGGGILDRRAGHRASQLAEARDDGDWARIDELESDARSARIANIALYAGGLTLLTGGVALQFIDIESSDSATESGFSMKMSPGSISAFLRW